MATQDRGEIVRYVLKILLFSHYPFLQPTITRVTALHILRLASFKYMYVPSIWVEGYMSCTIKCIIFNLLYLNYRVTRVATGYNDCIMKEISCRFI